MDKRKVVIITGASGGVGAATACWMGKDSATVVLVARSKDRLDDVAHKVEQLGGTALVIPTDVSDPIACQNIVDTTLKYYKEIHALINNAGIISPLANIEHTDLKDKAQLEPPEIPARSIAWLALHAPHNMSGEFRNYNDPDIAGPALSVYGSTVGRVL
jgi:NADP-dependent 3-hydroxy acid dehydrogenase YdfG